MATKYPVICIFGAAGIQLQSSPEAPTFETTTLDCRCFPNDRNLDTILIRHNPHVLVSFGDLSDYPKLMAAPFEIRRRWLHYPDTSDLATVGIQTFHCYLSVCLEHRDEEPLVSVFTPTYHTGQRFLRPLRSLSSQTYNNWEWIIWDDSNDGGATFRMIRQHANCDHRIRPIKPEKHSGIIGEVKYNACAMSRGEILLELDHDDELTPDALANLIMAYKKYPEAGFFYSDFSEVNSDGHSLRYPEGWGYGYGSYRREYYAGKILDVANAPNINPKTIRHLVAAPNHLRAWTRACYFAIGGHNRFIHVADDFELLIRTFLHTPMVRIPKLCYLQYIEGNGNTQRIRNQDIQRHVRYLRWKYDEKIHARFLELGVDDWVWNKELRQSDLSIPNSAVESTASLIADLGG